MTVAKRVLEIKNSAQKIAYVRLKAVVNESCEHLMKLALRTR